MRLVAASVQSGLDCCSAAPSSRRFAPNLGNDLAAVQAGRSAPLRRFARAQQTAAFVRGQPAQRLRNLHFKNWDQEDADGTSDRCAAKTCYIKTCYIKARDLRD